MDTNNTTQAGTQTQNASKIVEIYSTPTCHFCHMAKDWLTAKNIAFVDYNVGENAEKRKEMVEMTGQLGVPVIRIGDDVMIGFNPDHMAKLLEVAN
jgi:glutaredoxin-like YruB-family protein